MTDYNYNSRDVSIILGSIIVKGYADGDFLSIDFDDDAFTLAIGADGDAVRSVSNKQSATITLTLMASSPTNNELSALHFADRAAGDGSNIKALTIKDAQGTTLLEAEKCYIQKAPTQAFGVEIGERAWTLRCVKLSGVIGGSTAL